jgi:hypothetical protein
VICNEAAPCTCRGSPCPQAANEPNSHSQATKFLCKRTTFSTRGCRACFSCMVCFIPTAPMMEPEHFLGWMSVGSGPLLMVHIDDEPHRSNVSKQDNIPT